MLPDLESVRCFVAAATHRSFRAAARAVALSPPAFGDRIKRLEDGLGVRLFERTTRRLELTEAGIRALVEARRLLDGANRLADSARTVDIRTPFELAIGTRFELGLSWLVPALRDLSDRCPERTLHLAFGDGPDLLAKVRGERLDAAITSARLTQTDLRYALLHEEAYVFVASRALLRKNKLNRFFDAASHTLLDLERDLPLFRYFLDATPEGERWAFGAIHYLGTIAALRHRVMEGAGVAVLPLYFVRHDIARRRLAALFPKKRLQRDHFRLVWRRGHPLEPRLIALAADLRARPLR